MQLPRQAGSVPTDTGDAERAPVAERPFADRATIARLEAELLSNAMLIHEQQSALAHFRKLFERASEAARIGVWHCELADDSLTWTDVVYDLFGLPRGAPLSRAAILEHYPEHSRRRLEEVRSRAIAERSGFELDTEIHTAAGEPRWIRITATVECEQDRPVRIFGMKQDITEERRLAERLRAIAETDAVTGLSNRAAFQARLARMDDPADPLHAGGTLIVIDLDGFKQVNDRFGHVVGDECLRLAAGRLAAAVGDAELVARIGGDEFAVVLAPSAAGRLEETAAALVAALADPVTVGGFAVSIGASVGAARINGSSSTALYRRADAAMYAAKSAGRNCWRLAD